MTTQNIPAQLFFLYDSHCPWSYVTTKLVNEINQAFPAITINLWHAAFFDGKNDDSTSSKLNEIKAVENLANIKFPPVYKKLLETNKSSILAANLMTWAQHKTPHLALTLLNALQKAHFEQGNKLTNQADLDDIINELKLSPPTKVFKNDKLSKDVFMQLEEIYSLQEMMNTEAIPALLLAVNDQLILLNHNFYLTQPSAIIEAVELELNKYQ
ncbi:DsbA family protein [Colwellia sp. 4_MG-2023]|uniref:DsbA family protein n=1 Tax=unclassified Colwellia TaxID=196834 RepID=UPI0020910C7F|nr:MULTISPECIES: DsbA family protein [unclassified Colwellia]MDO6507474.1 DsbA family protein [Colwellia sp. 5_MG-2023]MDO6556268.1 DsbA family protein [Colwellia sp. 4_MG-2023]MDO6651096.1 DsbA family protein [Colwellia sp. 3_MG-2023]MDO6666390.1 DsbA family protein [Colwellia sp. 2_MG-2023]MDO6690684.1 DsbA family protein [Colwellia sp. 1_MG-2023]